MEENKTYQEPKDDTQWISFSNDYCKIGTVQLTGAESTRKDSVLINADLEKGGGDNSNNYAVLTFGDMTMTRDYFISGIYFDAFKEQLSINFEDTINNKTFIPGKENILCEKGGKVKLGGKGESYLLDVQTNANKVVVNGELEVIGNFRLDSVNQLEIAGTVTASDFVIKLPETTVTPSEKESWPDYVFNKDYKLASLSDIKSFITSNGHLPDVPSKNDVQENGIGMGEMVKILLKKVEELTLHVINQDEKIKLQNNLLATLNK